MLKVLTCYLITSFCVLLATDDFQQLTTFITLNFQASECPPSFKPLSTPIERAKILGYFALAFNESTEKEISWKAEKEAEAKLGHFTFLMHDAFVSYRKKNEYNLYLASILALYQSVLKKIIGTSTHHNKMKTEPYGVNTHQHFLWITFNRELLTLPFLTKQNAILVQNPYSLHSTCIFINKSKVESRKGLLAIKEPTTDQVFKLFLYGGEETSFSFSEKCLVTSLIETDHIVYMPYPITLEEIDFLNLSFLHHLEEYETNEAEFSTFPKSLLVEHRFDVSLERAYRTILDNRNPGSKIDVALKNTKLLQQIHKEASQIYGKFLNFMLQVIKQVFEDQKIDEAFLQKLEKGQNFFFHLFTECMELSALK